MDTINKPRPADSTRHLVPNTQHQSSKPRILIVDNDVNVCGQLKSALAKDYDVFLAGDRQSALQVVRKEKTPVVMLDLGLSPHPQEVDEGLQTLSDIVQEHTLA